MILISISYNGWSTFLDTFLETVEKKSGFGVNIMPFPPQISIPGPWENSSLCKSPDFHPVSIGLFMYIYFWKRIFAMLVEKPIKIVKVESIPNEN